MSDDEFKCLFAEETVYDFEKFVKLEIIIKIDEPNDFSQNLDFESFEAEKSDVENEKIGQKLEKLSKKFVVDLKKLANKKTQPSLVLSQNSNADSLYNFDKEKPNFESEYSSLQDGRSMNSEIISESELPDSPSYGNSDEIMEQKNNLDLPIR